MAILEVQELSKNFGGLAAVNDLNFQVDEGEIRALIGPNGAGKTTTFNVISGYYRPSGGAITYRGRDISGLKASAIAALGLVRTFQSTTLFQEFTVFENVLVGCHLHARTGFVGTLLGTDRRKREAAEGKAREILDFFDLATRKDELAMNLPHGLQRALGVAIALAAEPKLLLLDEPMTGMNLEEKEDIARFVIDANEQLGCTITLIEHDMGVVMDISDRVIVLDYGRKIAEGLPEEIKKNQKVIDAYLGSTAEKRDAAHR